METASETKFEFGDLADCHRGEHAELLEVDGDSFCPRCGIVVEKKKMSDEGDHARRTLHSFGPL